MEIPGCGLNRNKSEQIIGKGFTMKPRANKTLQSQTCTRSTLGASSTPPVENHRISTESSAPVRLVSLTGQTDPAQKPRMARTHSPETQTAPNLNSSYLWTTQAPQRLFPRENPNSTSTGQTGVGHRSDRCGSGTSGKTGPRAKPKFLFT